MKKLITLSLILIGLTSFSQKESSYWLKSSDLGTFSFRNLGPALTSGRIADFAVNPNNRSEYYVAVASGGVWKTTNAGTTYSPIFDGQGSYSIGCITMDPNNEHVLWVGTGENNNQRSVAYGDGVYLSKDGGKSWKNMGLKESEHIGMIAVDPRNSDVVYVAAYGPLWSAGGDRGIYKTVDGGTTWNKVLEVSENTGFNEIHLDPRNPDVLYATAHQRRRHVFTYISGGPESAIYKSTDGGANWTKLTSGLPSGDVGRIGLAVAPTNPDILYAIIEAAYDNGGFFKSTDRGESWSKVNDLSTSGNYYQELVAHPTDPETVFVMNTYGYVTRDGGKNFEATGERNKHVDNHCLWIDPKDDNYMLAGCDGGIYETFDRAKTWKYHPNLPIIQFYKVSLDRAKPFYNVYGGTQDNFSMGGPSRTIDNSGIPNEKWFLTKGGDGFETQVDPTDPNIIYAQSQYGYLVRYDRQSGERTDIKPMPKPGEDALVYNWDAPLIISPHSHTRLYFGANKLYKSDDRGQSWQAISGDLTAGFDRNTFPVMDRIWSVDAVMKNKSTSIYGALVALHESPVSAGLIYAGSDDGLIHVTGNDGLSWKTYSSFPGVPERTYVNYLLASQHDTNTVYAVFNNHKNGDFKPYLLKSTDRGTSWTSIASNLPERGSVYCIAEDHENPNLLFAGTEFGAFVSIDGGQNWVQLKSGLPTIAVRDMEIQPEHNDLVLASFGRGFFVLDNYAPMRELSEDLMQNAAHIFEPADALMYREASPNIYGKNGFKGETWWAADNPTFGATITYYVKESLSTRKGARKKAEAALAKDGNDTPYPSYDALRAEDTEEAPYLFFDIKDEGGNLVRRLKAPARKGIQSITWDFEYASLSPIDNDPLKEFYETGGSFPAGPGTYYVSLHQVDSNGVQALSEPTPINCVPLNNLSIPAADRDELEDFYYELRELNRVASGARNARNDIENQWASIRALVQQSPDFNTERANQIEALRLRLYDVSVTLNGDETLSSRDFATTPSLSGRLGTSTYYAWNVRTEPTEQQKENAAYVRNELPKILDELKSIQKELNEVFAELSQSPIPQVPGQIPELAPKK